MGKAKHDCRQSGCGIAYGLDIFGDKWTLVVLRDMILMGKQRFNELLTCREKIASNILSDRLKRLDEEGIISRKQDPENDSKFIYELTAKGKELIPVILEVMRWGAKHAPNSSSPPELVKWVKQDREGVVKSILDSLKKNQPFVRVQGFVTDLF